MQKPEEKFIITIRETKRKFKTIEVISTDFDMKVIKKKLEKYIQEARNGNLDRKKQMSAKEAQSLEEKFKSLKSNQDIVQFYYDELFYKPLYNNERRENRHLANKDELQESKNTTISAGSIAFIDDKQTFVGDSEDASTYEEQEVNITDWLSTFLKAEQIKMFVCIGGLGGQNKKQIQEYAESINDSPNNVSKRYNRIKKKIAKKYLEERPIF